MQKEPNYDVQERSNHGHTPCICLRSGEWAATRATSPRAHSPVRSHAPMVVVCSVKEAILFPSPGESSCIGGDFSSFFFVRRCTCTFLATLFSFRVSLFSLLSPPPSVVLHLLECFPLKYLTNVQTRTNCVAQTGFGLPRTSLSRPLRLYLPLILPCRHMIVRRAIRTS